MTSQLMLPVDPISLQKRSVGEWHLVASGAYERPFFDVEVDTIFTSPSGKTFSIPAFYDGDQTWKIRFNPGEEGYWEASSYSRPENPEFLRKWSFTVVDSDHRGFLQSTPDRQWGYTFENGDAFFPFGDTVYNLFGMAHCGYDVKSFIRRRIEQGFNLLRIRLPVSRFHPPAGISDWQTRSCWPWGGSEQAPMFDRFNLEYFRTVDDIVVFSEQHGMGLELIMEAWGFEFPFNSRIVFTPEWELLWMRYLVARYDAFSATYFWTPLNEYEFYPNGDWNHTESADLWQMRIARWIRETASHGHCVAAHNGPRMPAFANRFARDPEVIDTVMYQNWGTADGKKGWLTAGLEDGIDASLAGWKNSAIMAEWGYERNPALDLNMPGHEFCDTDHTRRGAWRSVFRGLGIVHGFENSWGPWCLLDEDQPGINDLFHVRSFVMNVIGDSSLRTIQNDADVSNVEEGYAPLFMASHEGDLILAYLPAGGVVSLELSDESFRTRWYDPRSGEESSAFPKVVDDRAVFESPSPNAPDRPDDWVLICDGRKAGR